MTEAQGPTGRAGSAGDYEIRVDGRLDDRWSAWFDGLTVTYDGHGTTVLRGPIVDQAALHGVLAKVRDLGLSLLSVTSSTDDPSDPAASRPR